MSSNINKIDSSPWCGTRSPAELLARCKAVAPGGVHSPVRAFRGVDMPPLFFESAEGAHIHSVEGEEYIDFCMSFGPLILGHRDPDISREVHRMVDTAWTFGAPEPYSLELAEWIQGAVPAAERVRFVCSGTEAVMSAMRVARAATGRSKVLKFTGCYHGHLDALLVQAGSGLAGESASSSAGVPAELVAQTLVCPLNDEKAAAAIFERQGKEIALLALEPLPANFGLLPQREEYLRFIFKLARDHGALILFDEVISGFRVGKGGMAAELGLTPDLLCFGKIIGGGFPVGAYAGRAELMRLVAPEGPVYQAGTLAANPIGMRAGLATLKKVFSSGNFERLEEKANNFCNDLRSEMRRRDLSVHLTSKGTLFWFHRGGREELRTPDEIPAGQADWYKRFYRAALGRGIYMAPNAYEVNFLSLAHDDAILARAKGAFLAALEEAEKQA